MSTPPVVLFDLETSSRTPHRGSHVVELDEVPVHRQSFALKIDKPAQNRPNKKKLKIVVPSNSYSNSLSRESLSPLTPVTVTDADPSEIRDSVGPVRSAVAHNRTKPPYRLIKPPPIRSEVTEYQACSPRKERKIRSINETLGWFVSTGTSRIDAPLSDANATAQPGDLYLHSFGVDKLQSWLMDESRNWKSVKTGHPHPVLSNYRLSLANTVPGWVTAQTVKTYQYRGHSGQQDEI